MSDWKSQLRYFACHRFVDGCCTCNQQCDSPGKHPKGGGWQQRATSDPEIVAQILNDPTSNPAIATGKASNLFVLDVDGIDGLIALAELEKANGRLPDTHKVRTGSGGWHYYFQYPSVELGNAVRFLPGLDTRGEGGLVIAAGARNNKGPYFVKNHVEPAVMPEWLVTTIRDATKKKSSRKTERLTKGNRNNAIFKLACSLHHSETSYDGALEACMKEAARAVPPLPESEVTTVVKSAYGYPTDDQAQLDLSDQGLTGEFIASNPPLRYVTDDQSWVAYSNGFWLPKETPTHEIGELLKSLEPTNISNPKTAASIHRRLNSKAAVSAVTFFAEASPALGITADQFDPDPMLLGLPDGEALDLRTGERRAATLYDLITRALPVAPAGRCERWERYLEETHPDDPLLIAYLQRLVGYWLTSSTTEDMIAFFIGVGGSGKGTFTEPLQKLWGRYCIPIPIGMLLEDTTEDRRLNYIADLCGARLAICNEGSKLRRLDSRGIKMLTGGGWAVGRRLGHQAIRFKQTHKIVVLANDNPVLELDDAMKQRVHVVPFNQKFRDTGREQKGLREFFTEPEQMQGILQWAVHGCLAYQKDGLKPPASVTATTEQYFKDADLFEQFLGDHTEEGQGLDFFESTENLFRRWAFFCERQGHKDKFTVGNTTSFASALKQKRPRLKLGRTYVGSDRLRGFVGIKLLRDQQQKNFDGVAYDDTR